MRILFTRFPLESTYGGAEMQTMTLMRGLMAHGHAITFLGSCPTLLKLCQEEGIPTAELDIGVPPVTKWDALHFLWRGKRMQRQLLQAVDQFRDLDALCMLSLSEKILLTKAAKAKGTRVFWIEHDRIGPWLTRNPWLMDLRRSSYLATTICVSELSRKKYINLGWDPTKVVTIANGIDEERFESRVMSHESWDDQNSSTSRLKTQHSRLHVGTIARLSPEKGIDVLIEAIAPLPNVHCTIVGHGKEEAALKNLIASKKMTNRVEIIPSVDDLGTFYRSLDAFILPSRDHDPFGLVAAEAMLCGVPTIVTDECGIAGYLQDKVDALVVPAGDHGALTQAISSLADESVRQRLAENGVKTAKEKFSAKRMLEEYEMLFNQTSPLLASPRA